jgi:mxaJ protein
MCSASDLPRLAALAAALAVAVAAAFAAPAEDDAFGPAPDAAPGVLRVCADPNNLPFSNAHGEGFENRIASILGEELHLRVAYAWWPQRRGFVRKTLNAGRCDLAVGVPAQYGLLATTRPYYRSSYVFVTRRDRQLAVTSFDDPRLRTLKLGVHLVGDDYNNVPPAQALAWRAIVDNVRGYPIYGDYSRPDPPRGLIDAVARGEVDVGIAWGPLAGYFATRESAALDVVPVSPELDRGMLPMRYAIAVGMRRGDTELRDRVQAALDHRRDDIEAVLRGYGVPLLPLSPRPAARKE